jgi:hypothetical protein
MLWWGGCKQAWARVQIPIEELNWQMVQGDLTELLGGLGVRVQ